MENKSSYLKQHVINSLFVLSIALIAFLSYKNILSYFFTTAGETLRQIDSSRIQSFDDISRIFSEPILPVLPFYRPITKLSYGMDYSIWRLNPFGYHLTDLVLHILVSVFVFFLSRLLTKGNQVTAWLAAIIFTTHPILIGTVPAIICRADIIVTLFIVLSLLLFVKYYSTIPLKKVYLFSSLFFFVLALMSKEIAIILPFLIFTLTISLSTDKIFLKDRMIKALRHSLPYFLIAFIFFAWRAYILKGIGKYAYPKGLLLLISRLLDVNINFLVYLLYPVDFLGLDSLFGPFPGPVKKVGFMAALLLFFAFLLFYRRVIYKIINHDSDGAIKIIKILLVSVSVCSVICILFYPLMVQSINHFIQGSLVSNVVMMENGNSSSAQAYFYMARDLILKASVFLLFFCLICLTGVHQRENIRRLFIKTDDVTPVGFLLFWLMLQLGIYISGLSIAPRYIYMPTIAFSIILSIMIVENFQSITKKFMKYRSNDSSLRSSLIGSTNVRALLMGGLLISLLSYSPLIKTYKGWEYNGEIAQMFLQRVSEILPELSNDAVIHIYNLPRRVLYQEEIKIDEVTYCLDPPTIKSWINLNYPDNQIKVIVHSDAKILVYHDKPVDIKFKAKKIADDEAVVYGILENVRLSLGN